MFDRQLAKNNACSLHIKSSSPNVLRAANDVLDLLRALEETEQRAEAAETRAARLREVLEMVEDARWIEGYFRCPWCHWIWSVSQKECHAEDCPWQAALEDNHEQ